MTKKLGKALNKKCPECFCFSLRMIITTEEKGGHDFEVKEILCGKCGYSEPYHLSLSHKGKEPPLETSW
jgi:predicted nucleic-acid-binding Zn-ribbon protein